MRLPLAVTLLLAACSGSDAGSTAGRAAAPLEPTVRDSAGIEVAEHPADALDRAPLITVDTVPLARSGHAKGVEERVRLFGALMLSGGRLVVTDATSLLMVDQDGTITERIPLDRDSSPQLPLLELARGRGDTVLIHDPVRLRLLDAVPGGGVVRTRTVPVLWDVGVLRLAGGLADGSVAFGTSGYRDRANLPGPTELPWIAVRVVPGTDTIQRVDSVGGPVLLPATGGGVRMQRGSGWPAIVVAGDGLVSTSGRQWELRVVDQAGRLRRVIRLALPTGAGTRPGTGRPIRRLLAGPDGILWVSASPGSDADTMHTYAAVRVDGTILGRLELPRDHESAMFGPGVVVLPSEDAEGFLTLRVHRLHGLR